MCDENFASSVICVIYIYYFQMCVIRSAHSCSYSRRDNHRMSLEEHYESILAASRCHGSVDSAVYDLASVMFLQRHVSFCAGEKTSVRH